MARLIEFNAERLIGRLNILQAAQFNYAGKQTLKRLGYAVREHHAVQMARLFDNPVPYTLSSPRYLAEGLQVTLYLNPDGPKGNAPAEYIYPADRGSASNTAYLSRFSRGLRKVGVTTLFPVPFLKGNGVILNDYGNMSSGQYQQVLAGLKRKGSNYFSIPDARSSRSVNFTLPRGIYQRNKDTVDYLFGYLNSPPKVSQPYAFGTITRRFVRQQLPVLLREELAKALR